MLMSMSNQIKEPESFAGTVHIHLDENQRDRTQVCRFILDTGSDLNLVSESILRELGLSLTHSECEPPTIIGFGDAHILPIGSVFLTFHIDGKENKEYSEVFWVVSEDMPALFDLLFGKHWIKHHKALKRNSNIWLACRPRLHRSRIPTSVGAEPTAEGLR
jgi:hypothetical protein